MKCPNCGNEVKEGYKFCTKCGQMLDAVPQRPSVKNEHVVCPKCGSILKPGQKFCTKCGTSLMAAQQPSKAIGDQQSSDKGFIDNITHLGTFIQRGSRGVQAEVRREELERLQNQAQALGREVVKPGQQNSQNPQAPQQSQERRLVVDTNSIESVSLVNGRAIWDIQKGEVARLITETEFANATGLKGVIVQEGCTAMVFIDGQMVSMMQSGCYTFPAKTQTEMQLEQRQREIDAEHKELERQQRALEEEQRRKDNEYAQTFAARGVFGSIGAFGRGVMNFLFGKKKDEKPEQHRARVQRTEQRLRMIPSPKICRVYLVSNRVINLLFGSQTNADGIIEFMPMLIPTKLVDINVAVSMQLQINNIQQFVANYLADRKSVSVNDIQNELASGVKALLSQMLRNLDYQAEGLSESVISSLKNRLQMTCNERLQGIEVVRIMDITDSSADFERFRAVERELFASEKELGYLQRTNEFRNRMEQEQNKRTINTAQNTEDLRQALQAINKDKLISEDEMEQFVMLLESQKRIREATTKEEEYEALQNLRKNRLVKDDDVAALENALAQGKIDRENVTEIMRIQASQKARMAEQIAEFELSDSKMEHEMATALRQEQHKGNLASVQLDTKRLIDAYNDERNEFDWNRAFSRRQQEDDYNFNQGVRKDDYERIKREREIEANFRNRVQNEDYDYEKAKREQELREQKAQADYNRGRQDKFDDIDILERKGNIAMRNMHAMKEDELRKLQELNRSAENIHSMDVQERMHHDDVEMNMSAEQLRERNRQNLSEAAQVASFNVEGEKERAEFYRKQQEEEARRREDDRKRSMEDAERARADRNADMERMERITRNGSTDMKEMVREVLGTVRDVSASNAMAMSGQYQRQTDTQRQMYEQRQDFDRQRYEDQRARADEYRQDAYRQQDRMDHTQDTAMGSMAQIDTAMASNLGAFNGGFNGSAQQTVAMQQPTQSQHPRPQAYDPTTQQPATRICPACGAEVREGEMFCGECGSRMLYAL